jgi:hypothetical protein
MNTEDFENKLRSNDPAAHLEGRDTAEHRALFEKAINGQPANVISISRWSNRRKAVSAAAAALLVIGFGGPVISGATSAGPDRLVFGEAQNNMASDKSASGLESRNSSMGDYFMPLWGFYNYELNSDAVVNLPASAAAFKIVNIANIDARVQEIADALGVGELVDAQYEDGVKTNLEVDTASQNFYAWTQAGSASFSYYNSEADPWRDCYKTEINGDSTTSSEECQPISNNLYTASEAKAAAKQLLAKLGFDLANFSFDAIVYDYSTDVYVNEQINGIDSPVSYYVSFVANGELYTVGGSLTKFVEIGSYDLVNVETAISRANDLTSRTIDLWNESDADGSSDVEPGNTGSATTKDGEVSEPSEPRVGASESTDDSTAVDGETAGPQPAFAPTVIKVSKVELGYQMFYMADETVLWLPVANFYGTSDGSEDSNLYGTIVAVVDSQIDLESLYMTMGMLNPMSRSAMLD